MAFDYGNKQENGQYERYPTNTSGDYVAPIRRSYVHRKCGAVTTMSQMIADTYARNPKFYSRTFCTTCKEHLPVDEFIWEGTTIKVGELK